MPDGINLDDLISQINKDTNFTAPRQDEATYNLDDETLTDLMYICERKAEDFAILGYDKINGEEIWSYITSRYPKELPPLHRLVNEIINLKLNQYMNWITINAYKGI